ncbi:cytochrome P450 [Daedalea quercina L-15889]|uniref:Cytochrome P450 n=1 Tax=Daedalea quercina L-15889 TaxID=1314783 RepID=A0A165L5X4_9APHY|nr:cytochrome P450 [Daedalea quercina L-15889]
MAGIPLFALGAVLLLVTILRKLFKRSPFSHVRGPPSPSWLYGHSFTTSRETDVGDLQFQWMHQYGSAWRMKDCFNKDSLWIVDPKAIQYVLQTSGYHFPRTAVGRHIARQFTGESILYVEGDDHARVRKIMNPAFNAAQLRSFLPLFTRSARKLTSKWRQRLQTAASPSDNVLNVNSWFTRTTLDVIGEAAYDYHCGALDEEENEVVDTYKDMFRDSVMYPSGATLLWRSLWPYIPDRLLRLTDYLPTREARRFRRTLNVINKLSKRLIAEKAQTCLERKDENLRDIMSILVKANHSENPKTRMKDKEMMSQMATFFLAGHETTASMLTWMLYELAKDQEYQSKMREEIALVRDRVSQRGDDEFTVADLDSMSFVIAGMKEAMRLHPIVYTMVRNAERDDVIPLSKPVRDVNGNVISEIPVSKDTIISLSLCGYNRLPEVWGKDARMWNPYRWMNNTGREKQINVGVYGNLLTFSGGVKACIGWRFTVIELQAICVELLENFEFAIPDDKPDIQRVPGGLMIPMIRGKPQLGSQMPLKVTPIERPQTMEA